MKVRVPVKSKLKKLWGSMHDNLHSNQMKEIDEHIEFIKEIYDFWPIAYYPFGMSKNHNGFFLEDLLDEKIIESDWEIIRKKTIEQNNLGYPMFMGYEWQGSGEDGDHNIFFLNNDYNMYHPHRYNNLKDYYDVGKFIAIPHHIAYKLGNRGKNWSTHDESISPFAEIFSSHGSSETDFTELPMARHIHMGPRVENTSYKSGLLKGIKIGSICSGDNHKFSGQYENGNMCVLASDSSKEAIWEGLINGRVYGLSKGRMDIDCYLDDHIIGSTVKASVNSNLKVRVIGDYAIDRIEVLKDEVLEYAYYNSGKWENKVLPKEFKIKTKIEFGWGPDTRIFKDITSKKWDVTLKTTGQILDVEKNWNSFGQKIISQDDKELRCELTTRKSTDSGKWMASSDVKNEAFTLELFGSLDDELIVYVFGNEYVYKYRELLSGSVIENDEEAVKKLLMDRYSLGDFYRNDSWWHNSYKFKIHQAVPEESYTCKFNRKISTIGAKSIRIKVFQKNGAVAFVSPIFIEE